MKPRATDAAVHRALWPDVEMRLEPTGWWRYKEALDEERWMWSLVPAYTTSLMAWDWERLEWAWKVEEHPYLDTVRVELYVSYPGKDPLQCSSVEGVSDHNNNRFQAQAFARALCVLAWAEREEVDDVT